jgi:hypothetical protein
MVWSISFSYNLCCNSLISTNHKSIQWLGFFSWILCVSRKIWVTMWLNTNHESHDAILRSTRSTSRLRIKLLLNQMRISKTHKHYYSGQTDSCLLGFHKKKTYLWYLHVHAEELPRFDSTTWLGKWNLILPLTPYYLLVVWMLGLFVVRWKLLPLGYCGTEGVVGNRLQDHTGWVHCCLVLVNPHSYINKWLIFNRLRINLILI